MVRWACLASVVLIACSAGDEGGTTTTSGDGAAGASSGAGGSGAGTTDGGAGGFAPAGSGGSTSQCATPPTMAGAEATLAAEFAQHYAAYELGPVPGVPDQLGGCVIEHDDPNTLLIAGASESAQGQIFAIEVERGPCNHIIGFVGTAEPVASTPYVDANLVYGPSDLMFYTQWPQYVLSQLPAGDVQAAVNTDLAVLGVETQGDQGPGGVGFVPPALSAAGELRIVSWPGGRWYHVEMTPNGALFDVTGVTEARVLPNNPGGFAYVPAGSAGFPVQSLIVAEWVAGNSAQDRVATYEVDDQGDPILGTRKEFFTSFPRPWGAYFEPLTGDYLFLTWDTNAPPDRVFIVQGFEPPPPPPQ